MIIAPAISNFVRPRRPLGRLRSSSRTLAIAAMLAAGFAAVSETHAATQYTTRTTFNSAVKPGSYTESFDSLGDGDLMTPSLTFSSGAFSFVASTGAALPDDNDLLGADGTTLTDFLLSTAIPSDLTFTFPGGNVTAIGGDFTLTNDSFKVATDTFTLTLSDGTTVTRTSGTNTPFFGFTSAVPITSLTFAVPADATPNNYFATVNNFTVGAAVPEPTSLALALVAGAGLLSRRRHRADTTI